MPIPVNFTENCVTGRKPGRMMSTISALPTAKERLIPAIPQVIVKVDVEGERMEIRPLKGLFDDEPEN